MKRRKPAGNKKAPGVVKTTAIGLGISVGVTLILAMLFAKLVLSGTLPERAITWAAWAIVFLCVLCGSLFSAKCAKQNKLPVGMAEAGIYFLLLGVFHALLMQHGFANVLPIGLCCLAGGLLGSLLGAKQKRKRRFA